VSGELWGLYPVTTVPLPFDLAIDSILHSYVPCNEIESSPPFGAPLCRHVHPPPPHGCFFRLQGLCKRLATPFLDDISFLSGFPLPLTSDFLVKSPGARFLFGPRLTPPFVMSPQAPTLCFLPSVTLWYFCWEPPPTSLKER